MLKLKMAEALPNMSLSSEELEALANTAKDSVSGMNEKEIQEHLQLCMKLSAENKINFKNAFGLHLIGILPRLAKDKNTDLQTASLSLQASSKIYCGRVDALYKETFQFHNHLQTILCDGKRSSGNNDQDLEGGDGEGPSEKGKTSQKKKFKSYVTTDESLSHASQTDKTSKPHQNFELVKSAFSGSTFAKKLLNCLRFENDSCEMSCARSSKIYNPKKPVSAAKHPLTKTEHNLWQKTSKLASEWDVVRSEAMEMSRNLLHSPNQSLPVGLDGSFLGDIGGDVPSDFAVHSPLMLDMGNDDDSLVIGNDIQLLPEGDDSNGFHVLNERFCALDITAGSFANDIAQALARDGSINPTLLPPQSTLRKVLKTSEKANLRKEANTEKKKKEVKPREPFFREQEVDNSLFMPGKRTVLSEAVIDGWDKFATTELGTGFDAFDSELNAGASSTILEEFKELPYTVMEGFNPYYSLKNPFLKKKQVWKLCRDHRPSLVRNREDSPGIFRRVASMAPPPEQLVDSFRNLTINDSFNGHDDVPVDVSFRDEEVSLADFADDIQLTLVSAPELVKPINVRPQQKAMEFDTQKVKQNLWSIISSWLDKNESVVFSEVCDELNKEIKSKEVNADGISWQFAFVMLLVLANEKVLLLENVGDGKDLVITKDVSEDVASI